VTGKYRGCGTPFMASMADIRAFPMADLHSHIDGSVSPKDLFRIAKRHRRRLLTPKGVELDSVTGFMSYVVGVGYQSMLDNIVDRFYPITGLMQTEETITEVAVAYVRSQKADGVAYAEGRFAPQYHTKEGLSLKDIVRAMANGLSEGSESYGVKTNLIAAIGRETSPEKGVDIARAAASSGVVVALDLCGPEAGYPPGRFREAFRVAAEAGLKVTVHAGEGAGSVEQDLANMKEAIAELGANRLGHAIPLSRSEGLMKMAMAGSVAIEMNPVSNLVLGNIGDLRDLAIGKLLNRGILVTINSDDPAIWPGGHLPDVYQRVCSAYGFGLEEVGTLVRNSISCSFASAEDKDRLSELYRNAVRKSGGPNPKV